MNLVEQGKHRFRKVTHYVVEDVRREDIGEPTVTERRMLAELIGQEPTDGDLKRLVESAYSLYGQPA
jgi:hypothetical protein